MARPGLTRHRKFLRLSRAIGGAALALGSLELVWSAAYESGDELVGNADDVEQLAMWQGQRGALTSALIQCGFLDETDRGLIVHDLWHHAPEYVQRRRRREAQRRGKDDPCPVTDRPLTGQCPVDGDQVTTTWSGRVVTPAPAPAPSNTLPLPLPSREGRKTRLRSMSVADLEAAAEAIRARAYPGAVMGADAKRLDALYGEIRAREREGAAQ